MPRLCGICDVDELHRGARLFEGGGDDERHRLAEILNVRAGQDRTGTHERHWQRRIGNPLSRRIVMRHHQAHARRLLGAGRVDARDAALGDRRAEDVPIERLADVPLFVGVGCSTGDLQWAVDPADWLSDDRHAISSVRRYRVRQRAGQRALGQIDLEVVVPAANGVLHRRVRGGAERGHGGGATRQRGFRDE